MTRSASIAWTGGENPLKNWCRDRAGADSDRGDRTRRGLLPSRREQRQQPKYLGPGLLLADRLAIGAAAHAVAEVVADRNAAQRSPAELVEQRAHLGAAHVAGVAAGGKSLVGPEDERLDLRRVNAER